VVGQLPAAIVSGGDNFGKRPDFKLWRARDLDLDLRSGHIKIEETFCGRTYIHTYVRAYVRMYGHLRPALLGWLLSKSQP